MTLEIHEQPRLPLTKQVELTLDGIHHRWARSVMALSVIVLAVAFLMNTLTEHVIARSSREGLSTLAQRERELSWLADFLASDMTAQDLQRRLAALPREQRTRPLDSWLIRALRPWLGIGDEAAMREFYDLVAATEQAYAWFDGLRIGHRRRLTDRPDSVAAFRALEDPAERERFVKAARQIPLSLPPGFDEVSARHRELREKVESAVQHHNSSRQQLNGVLKGASVMQWLGASQNPTRRRQVGSILRANGLDIHETQVDHLLSQASAEQERHWLLDVLSSSAVARAWTREYGGVYEQGAAIAELASDADKQRWLAGQAGQAGHADRIGKIAKRIVDSRRVNAAEESLVVAYGEQDGLSARAFWLIVVSLMVCIAGISNAMLVSVIERFREIATMKCLGALNGFIAMLFLLEAALLGLVGGIIGVILGAGIGVGRMALSYGGWVGRFFPWVEVVQAAGVSVLCGLLLATLAAVYPARLASRMAPIEAMRVE